MKSPILTESIYVPVLLAIQMCLVLEVISLWLGEFAMAFAFRLMIGLIVGMIYYLCLYCERYTSELSHLLGVVAIQDVVVMTVTQGPFAHYVWLVVYLPILVTNVDLRYSAEIYEWWQRRICGVNKQTSLV